MPLIYTEKQLTWIRRLGSCYLRLRKKSEPQHWHVSMLNGATDLKELCDNNFMEFLAFALK